MLQVDPKMLKRWAASTSKSGPFGARPTAAKGSENDNAREQVPQDVADRLNRTLFQAMMAPEEEAKKMRLQVAAELKKFGQRPVRLGPPTANSRPASEEAAKIEREARHG